MDEGMPKLPEPRETGGRITRMRESIVESKKLLEEIDEWLAASDIALEEALMGNQYDVAMIELNQRMQDNLLELISNTTEATEQQDLKQKSIELLAETKKLREGLEKTQALTENLARRKEGWLTIRESIENVVTHYHELIAQSQEIMRESAKQISRN